MLFVSKYSRYSVGIKADVVEVMSLEGAKRTSKETLVAEFQPGEYLSSAERLYAERVFYATGGDEVFGARPANYAGVMEGPIRATFEAHDPKMRFSGFRTETVPVEHRAEYERVLLANGELGKDYILVEAGGLEKPWPAYDKTPPAKIAGVARDMGLDLSAVAQYERAVNARPEVLAALERTWKRDRDAASEDAALDVIV